MSWSDAMKRYEGLRGEDKVAGFYRSRNAMRDKHFYLLVTPHTSTHYKVTRYVRQIPIERVWNINIEYDARTVSSVSCYSNSLVLYNTILEV